MILMVYSMCPLWAYFISLFQQGRSNFLTAFDKLPDLDNNKIGKYTFLVLKTGINLFDL